MRLITCNEALVTEGREGGRGRRGAGKKTGREEGRKERMGIGNKGRGKRTMNRKEELNKEERVSNERL